jgi:hypothetical protein
MGSSLANGLDAAPPDDLMGINEVKGHQILLKPGSPTDLEQI